MILFALLIMVFLGLSHIIIFPKTKGVLRPLKVSAKQERK